MQEAMRNRDAARVREHEAGDEEDSLRLRIGSIVNDMPEYVDSLGRGSRGSDDGDQPVDVRRYLGALRRGAWLIALIVVPLTLTVLIVSLTLSPAMCALLLKPHEAGHREQQCEDAPDLLPRLFRILSASAVAEEDLPSLEGRAIALAADAADDADLMRLEAQLKHRRLKRGKHGEIAAAGTPIRMDAAAVSLLR